MTDIETIYCEVHTLQASICYQIRHAHKNGVEEAGDVLVSEPNILHQILSKSSSYFQFNACGNGQCDD